MTDLSRSTLEFRSNLQSSDRNGWNGVYPAVRDPFALEQMQKRQLPLTPEQRIQYKYAALHCFYADPDDYPWGTILNDEGREIPVCKCLKTSCKQFRECRADFDPSELAIIEENRQYQARVTDFAHRREVDEKPSEEPEPKNTETDIHEPETDKPETEAKSAPAPAPETPAPAVAPPSSAAIIPEKKKPVKASFESFHDVPQDDLITADVAQRTVVNAGPGTGKTWTLIERIIHLLEEGVDPEGILILCFSRAAVEVISTRLQQAAAAGRIGYEFQNLDVRTFDSFATFAIAWVMDEHPELLPRGYSLEGQGYDDRIITAAKIMREKSDMLAQYEHMIVDEVQDLVGPRAELVLAMLGILPENCGFTLLGDACQALYDWQTEDNAGIMSSMAFYEQIFSKWPEINYWSFSDNHRQVGPLSQLATPYRSTILTGTAESRNDVAASILSQIEEAGLDIRHADADDFSPYRRRGTLGILTRTNGQALKISGFLRTADVPHVLQKPVTATCLKPWIADIFMDYPNATVNRDMFTAFCQEQGVLQTDVDEAWDALLSTQNEPGGSRFEVSDLLKGLLRNNRNRDLVIGPDVNAGITVSNIHRAKGREFDSVMILDEVLKPQEGFGDELQEHKVRYVAITRPKKELLDLKMKQQYIYIDPVTRRCFQANTTKRGIRYLTHIEIGLPGDIDNRTFAGDAQVQSFIRHELKPGTRLKLIKMPMGNLGYVQYRIVLEDDENICLGRTGEDFALGVKRAMQRIWDNYKDLEYKYYANAFSDIYVDELISCVAGSSPGVVAARNYDNMAIWKGFTVSGFAQYEKDLF